MNPDDIITIPAAAPDQPSVIHTDAANLAVAGRDPARPVILIQDITRAAALTNDPMLGLIAKLSGMNRLLRRPTGRTYIASMWTASHPEHGPHSYAVPVGWGIADRSSQALRELYRQIDPFARVPGRWHIAHWALLVVANLAILGWNLATWHGSGHLRWLILASAPLSIAAAALAARTTRRLWRTRRQALRDITGTDTLNP